MAKVIQQTIGGDLFRIETVEEYPLDHDPLVDQTAEEQDEGKRPELLNHVENMEQYETIILGFPNWWYDMPQTFLAGISYQPFVKNVTQGRKVIFALCAVNAVIDCNETDVFLWENHFCIHSHLQIVSP